MIRRAQVALIVIMSALLSVGVQFALQRALEAGNSSVVAKAYTFSPSTTIKSSEVNRNFDDLFTELSNIGRANLLADAVDTEELKALSVTEAKLAAAVVAKLVPSGTVAAYAGSSLPTGWLNCNGAAVSRTTYAALFTAIGTTYGAGDGSTTFNLPDITGRVVAGKESSATRLTVAGAGFSGATLGAAGGQQTVTLDVTMIPSHTHTQDAHNHTQAAHNHTQDPHFHSITDPGHNHDMTIPTGSSSVMNNEFDVSVAAAYAVVSTTTDPTLITINNATATNQAATATNNAATATNQSTGGSGAHLNTQPTIVLNYMIKERRVPRGIDGLMVPVN